jgi:hypothetical protein
MIIRALRWHQTMLRRSFCNRQAPLEGKRDMDQACDEFAHALYGAVLDAGQWKVAIARMAALADAPHAGLHDIDFAGGMVHREVIFGIEESYNRRYMQEFASIDPRVPVALGSNKLEWLSDYDYFTEEFRNNDRFYREYIYANGGGETLFASFAKEGSRLATAFLVRDMPVGCELIIKRPPGSETGHGSTVASQNDRVWQGRARMHRPVGPVSYRRASDEHAARCNSGGTFPASA